MLDDTNAEILNNGVACRLCVNTKLCPQQKIENHVLALDLKVDRSM